MDTETQRYINLEVSILKDRIESFEPKQTVIAHSFTILSKVTEAEDVEEALFYLTVLLDYYNEQPVDVKEHRLDIVANLKDVIQGTQKRLPKNIQHNLIVANLCIVAEEYNSTRDKKRKKEIMKDLDILLELLYSNR